VLDGSLLDAVARQVAARPDAVAVRVSEQTLTYAELDARADGLAAAVAARVEPGAPVGFLTPHDTSAVVCMLGIMKAGAAAVPLDPLQPASAQQAILSQAESPLVVITPDKAEVARATGVEALDLTELDGSDPDATAVPAPAIGPRDLSSILYTSGSSGEPKGVATSHLCDLQTLQLMVDTMWFHPEDRVGVVMPLSYRFAWEFTLCTLVSGGTVCFYDLRSDGFPGLPGWLGAEAITILPLVPTILRGLASGPPGRPFPTVRSVMISGERADVSDVEAARAIFAEDAEVIHALATTETQLVAMHFITPDMALSAPVPVGRAPAGKRIEVVDGEDRPVAAGELGEVIVHSPFLTEGYWRRPDLTDLVYGEPDATGVRSYRTGDLGVLRDDGVLELAGRGDSQVRVRGQRVELGEIEAALLDLEAVDAAVVVQQDPDGQGVLAAHVVLTPEMAHTTTADLRAALEADLADFKVPGVIVLLAALPLLPNGKVDRRALPVVDLRAGRAPSGGDGPRPTDQLEKELVRIWEMVIELSPISVDDDFFEISDSSLQAASIVVAIEESLGVELSVSALVRAPTIRQLANEVRRVRDGGDPTDGSGLVRVSTGNDGPRLLLCPDLSGSPFRLHPLAEALGSDVQVLGFESPLFSGNPDRLRTVEAFAAHNVAEAVAADPTGPYHLAGWSVGGFVAFEMARQMRRQGLPVGALVVVDAGPHMVTHRYPRFSAARRRSLTTPRPTAPAALRTEGDGATIRALEAVLPTSVVDRLVWRSDLRGKGQIRPERRLPYVWRAMWLATRDYGFGRYPGDVDFITSKPEGDDDPTSGLDAYVDGEVRLHRVVGRHEHLVLEPFVGEVAAAMRTALDRATT